MTIYYHLSTNIYHEGIFEPRIPLIRHRDQEDDSISRISVAPTIEDCLTAIPNGGYLLDGLNLQQRGYFLIFKIDTEKLGIGNEHIVQTKTLYEQDLVRDADVTNEVWITTPFKVPEEDRFLINLTGWREEPLDILPHSIFAIANDKYDGDYFKAYTDIYQSLVPSSVGIVDATYTHELVKEGQIISIYFEEYDEKVSVSNYLKSNFEVKIIEEDDVEIRFVMTKDSNLRDLFYHHKRIAI